MKHLTVALALMFGTAFAFAGDGKPAETKKVCHDNNGKQECRVVKVHKKAEKVTDGDPSAPEKKAEKKK